MGELKPCPVCGSNPVTDERDDQFFVSCSNDSCMVAILYYSEDEWNTRPIEDHLRARISVLVDALDEIYQMTDCPPEPYGDGPAPESDWYWPETCRDFANRMDLIHKEAERAIKPIAD